MTDTVKHDIKILNGLVETTLDSAEGYKEAGEKAKNTDFKALFAKRAASRRRLTTDLQAEVRRLGAEPEDDGTILAAAHRAFLNLKNSVTGSDAGVVKDVEAGEDHIKHKFEDALADNDVSPATKSVIAQLYVSVKADHDQMRDLKHSLQAAE